MQDGSTTGEVFMRRRVTATLVFIFFLAGGAVLGAQGCTGPTETQYGIDSTSSDGGSDPASSVAPAPENSVLDF